MDDNKGMEVEVTRPYTPISTNDQIGCFDLLIKDYGKENGWLSRYMCEDLPVGGMVREKSCISYFYFSFFVFALCIQYDIYLKLYHFTLYSCR